jgi:peptidoglycan/LPS O-acetylase OafA/YrhL
MPTESKQSGTAPSAPRRRLVEVDRVTGFAIFLVVVGHVVARERPADNEWYVTLKRGIYLFHMPLFMFVSGLVFGHTRVAIATLADYRAWAFSKIARLAPGFLLIGTLIVVGKTLSATTGTLHADNSQGDALAGIVRLFVAPTESEAASLWYIYVLLQFYLLFPALIALFRGREVIILALVAAMHAVHLWTPLPRLLATHSVFAFALYFWLGAMASARYERLLSVVRRGGPLFLASFVASFATVQLLTWQAATTVIGLCSIPAISFLVGLRSGSIADAFARLRTYAFVIYLLNTLAIGVTKGVMLKLLPWDGSNFYLYFVVLTAVGLGAPILAYRWFFSRSQTLARIMN